jgi:hypothetical protein
VKRARHRSPRYFAAFVLVLAAGIEASLLTRGTAPAVAALALALTLVGAVIVIAEDILDGPR